MLLLIKYTLLYGIVLMLVALGGMFSEHSGIINIALEGIMVIGGVAGVLTLTMLPAEMPVFLVVLISVLVAALAGMGKKVLLVDGDMQLNLSLSFFSEEEVLEMAAGEKNLYYAIGHQSDLSDSIVHTKYENLDLVPSSTLMSSVEYELFTKWQREFILRKG